MGKFKVYTTKKFGSNCSLCDFVAAVLSTLTKQTILPIIQKAMPIILTLFSTKMLFSNYSGNNLPRPTREPDTEGWHLQRERPGRTSNTAFEGLDLLK